MVAVAAGKPAHGFRCPTCHGRLLVRDSRLRSDGVSILRRYRCDADAEHKVTTVEIPIDDAGSGHDDVLNRIGKRFMVKRLTLLIDELQTKAAYRKKANETDL